MVRQQEDESMDMSDLNSQRARITKIEAAVEHVSAQVSQLSGSFSVLSERLSPFLSKVEEHDRALMGHDGEAGLIYKANKAMELQDNLRIIMNGREGQGGMLNMLAVLQVQVNTLIEQNRSQADERRWFTRIVLGILIAGLLSGFAYLLATHGISFAGQVVP